MCVCPTEGYSTPLTPEHMNLRSVLLYSCGSEPQTDAPPSVRDTSHVALTGFLANSASNSVSCILQSFCVSAYFNDFLIRV